MHFPPLRRVPRQTHDSGRPGIAGCAKTLAQQLKKKYNRYILIQKRFVRVTFIVMNIIRSWREQKILLKRLFPVLSDEDFVFEEGKKETMLRKLEEKLNLTTPELELMFAQLQTL
jgi:hypothetical protein